ncbi:MAG: hypothetical protein OEV59_02620 [Deltaproteobacteria bacterium]|nr:hypothetical protein [Deltaproteobacteria bacterium]
MTKSGTTFLVLLLLILSPCSLWATDHNTSHGKPPNEGVIHVLEGHDFMKGGYTLIGFQADFGDPIVDEIRTFYVDDPEVLEELKKIWVTHGYAPMYACGYHYLIRLYKDRKEVDGFDINLSNDCGTLVKDGASYYFHKELIKQLSDKYKKPARKTEEFSSIKDAREFLGKLKDDRNLLFMPTPEWALYEGEFRFNLLCKGFFGEEAEPCLTEAREKIAEKFPNEKFTIEWAGGSSPKNGLHEIMILVKSSKSLYDGFNLYKVDWKWRDYSYDLIYYSR